MSRILIVDDDEDFASAVVMVLQLEGHEVKIEPNISDALRQVETHPPDLIILDVMFPEDSEGGFSLRSIRNQEGTLSKIPILMLTGINSKYKQKFSFGDIDDTWLPVSGFLDKPVDFDVLRSKVTALLPEEDIHHKMHRT